VNVNHPNYDQKKISMGKNLLYRAANASIAQLQPFFDLLAVFVDGEGFLDIGRYLSV